MKAKSTGLISAIVIGLLVGTPWSGEAVAQQPIFEGLDLLETRIGDSFEDLSNLDALVPGCFVVGDPMIQLEGVPLGFSPIAPGQNLGTTDTIVARLHNSDPLSELGPPAFVDIQLVELHLQSVQPFQVECNSEQQLWLLDVTVGPGQPVGQMEIFRTHPNGGFFNSQLPVQPQLTFTRIDDGPPQVVLSNPSPQYILNASNVPWSYNYPPGTLEIPGVTSNFIAGVDPITSQIEPFNSQGDDAQGPPSPGPSPPPPNVLSLTQQPAAPVPEPASMAVWTLIAACGLGAAWRHRKQAIA